MNGITCGNTSQIKTRMCHDLLFSTRFHFSAPSFDSCSWQICWSSADLRMWRSHLQPPANVGERMSYGLVATQDLFSLSQYWIWLTAYDFIQFNASWVSSDRALQTAGRTRLDHCVLAPLDSFAIVERYCSRYVVNSKNTSLYAGKPLSQAWKLTFELTVTWVTRGCVQHSHRHNILYCIISLARFFV